MYKSTPYLWLRRPSSVLSKTRIVGCLLQRLWIHARARRIEKSFDVILTRRFDHVKVNHRVIVKQRGAIRLNEAHATHICRQIEDLQHIDS